MNKAVTLLIFLVAAICCLPSANARKRVSDRSNKVYVPQKKKRSDWKRGKMEITCNDPDSLLLDSVVYRGFDKPSSADMESFIVTNRTSRSLSGFSVEITYLSSDGEMLHRRTVEQPLYIPPGESRKCDVRSFDRNHSFYYHLSNGGRSGAAPFQVKMRTLALYFTPPQ